MSVAAIKRWLCCCAGFSLWIFPLPLHAAVFGPQSYLSALAKAKPGTVIQLGPGTYHGGLPIIGLNGTPDRPIVIEAADPARPPRFLAHPGRHTVSIVDASYVRIRNLVLDGQGLPVDAVRAEKHSRHAHHITLEGLHIIGHGIDQGIVGIATRCPAWGWVIRRNVIARAGTGMYLGNSDGSAPFFAGIIEHNLIYDTLGYNLQIKHQYTRPVDLEAPSGPQMTIIRHNVFSKFGNGTNGRNARPNLLVGHFPGEGSGADDHYAIYGNFFYANPAEALFQGEGNVALYANLFVNPYGDAVHIQPHNDVPRNIWLFNNTVVAKGAGIELRGATGDYLRLMRGNILFSSEYGVSELHAGNLVGAFTRAGENLIDPFASPGRLDLKPKFVRASKGWTVFAAPAAFPQADLDFDGRTFQKGDMGAYSSADSPRAWSPRIAPKP